MKIFRRTHLYSLSAVVFIALMTACGSSNESESSPQPEENLVAADFEILMLGNSHSAAYDLPNLIAKLIEQGLPTFTANAVRSPSISFLDERLNDGHTQALLESKDWTHVILQAQKYSTTGLNWYSTEAAEEWVRRVNAQQAKPIMFPEWARKGNTTEGIRIHEKHLYIASRESTCVAPIGLAWEEAGRLYPSLNLHADDGNHANLTGALLTAMVLYQVITMQPADELGPIEDIAVDTATQAILKLIARNSVDSFLHCS
ncbi:hypothetical protein ACUR5C_03575 [Aliikangiella sp. IMCC44653]